MIIYCFDILSKDKKHFNTTKRRFYYDLNKIKPPQSFFCSKSVICIEESKETEFDIFFSKYKDSVVLFKGHLGFLQKIYGPQNHTPPTKPLLTEV